MKTRPLSNTLGLEVSDFDVSGYIDHSMMSEIIELLYRHAVLCFRDQRVSPESLEKFGRRFGVPIRHVEENLRLQGLLTVMSLSNADERDDRQLNGGAHWHTDLIHTQKPASFTMLHAVAVPDSGGGTYFANQVAAYDALAACRSMKRGRYMPGSVRMRRRTVSYTCTVTGSTIS